MHELNSSIITKERKFMISQESTKLPNEVTEDQQMFDRRSFLTRASLVGATSLAFGALLSPASAQDRDDRNNDRNDDELRQRDRDILIAAEIAEALAVTTYTNIINVAPFFGRLESDDQGYLQAARQEEMSHYL